MIRSTNRFFTLSANVWLRNGFLAPHARNTHENFAAAVVSQLLATANYTIIPYRFLFSLIFVLTRTIMAVSKRGIPRTTSVSRLGKSRENASPLRRGLGGRSASEGKLSAAVSVPRRGGSFLNLQRETVLIACRQKLK